MSIDVARTHLTTIHGAATAALAALPTSDGPPRRLVHAGESLQAAINADAPLELEAETTWPETVRLRTGTDILGRPGSHIHGPSAPAVIVEPGTNDVTMRGFSATANTDEAVILLGRNTTAQRYWYDVPHRIGLHEVFVPTHRGRSAIAVNAAATAIIDCGCRDVRSRSFDSQGIAVLNSPGGLYVKGGPVYHGTWEAASENILVGGDTMKLVGVDAPTNLVFEDLDLSKPLAWMNEPGWRIKNNAELKNGSNVTFRRITIRGNWKDGQDGYAIVLTPTQDGRDRTPWDYSGLIENVLFEDLDIRDVANGINAYGYDYHSITKRPLNNVTVRRMTLVTDRQRFMTPDTAHAGGRLLMMSAESGAITIEDSVAIVDGKALVYTYAGTLVDPVTRVRRDGGKVGPLTLRRMHARTSDYGIVVHGAVNAANWQHGCTALDVEENVFGGASLMQSRLPLNTYLTREAFDARFVDAAAGDYRLASDRA